MNFDAIGGYFGLDLAPVANWRPDGIGVNSARSALELILRARQPSKVHLPSYCCSAVESAIPENIEICWYEINEEFEISNMPETSPEAPLLLVNYFGLKNEYAAAIVADKPGHVILDNSQAYYSQPFAEADCIYSPRKFLPVPDGGIVVCDALIDLPQKQATSSNRAQYLLGRADVGPEPFFEYYKWAEAEIAKEPPMQMSALTDQLLDHLDTERFAAKRRENFQALDKRLRSLNRINLPMTDDTVPMVYPFWPSGEGLREKLVENRVFAARYWPEVAEMKQASNFENELSRNMVPLPIDQRYDSSDMDRIAELCLSHLFGGLPGEPG
ncbi:MAG: hypothetical protein ACQEVT_17280 [Pseudomonadota bacterium]|uniref:hypothetical protein n=1 Tax=Roseovarius salincola TaxID=2978479 RepID=UPI0022A86DDC|nr:hypothetical protein [Roseovarius sp. EGI FJ00037]MCZ0814353.1 hypothetical protein [Roseovarius sp. EGI FJ00037]